ncbi:sirohydrochlorin chelatase [Thermomonospora curvata]|uniref:Cobalamin (Vitamin B12) biosynthesis CbiX protein n=1 Tax=Thermomonospora curvata (strain ATCC 19995 / DSM 43183 / JCM 3096 / KCTC 9072 / NBRC 15933 / NCIMB 10081 / Henssen B9) TaxID=471852 RepID=D1AEQ9_THECD|nr:CbiX/SirB N-terminal domain-containing protein [Thermomonospora curvata]ACY97634.1 cobalamin (vitamin B12) biosynthesis CbiX protein [Thermomonospora curvata DSM 43183]
MTGRRVVLVGGHESRQGRCLPLTEGSGELRVCGAGRDLHAAVRAGGPVVAVPMTLGRDPDLPRLAAQTLRWASRDRPPGEVLLAEPLGTVRHLVGWIRGVLARALRGAPPDRAALLVAPAAGPEPDAELFKVARLVWQHAPVRRVEVALLGGEPDVDEGVDRCLRLGADGVVLVPASFVPAPQRPGVRTAGPLLGPAALAALIRARAAEAELRWERHGDDGTAATGHGHHHDHADRRRDPPVPAATNLKGAASHVR